MPESLTLAQSEDARSQLKFHRGSGFVSPPPLELKVPADFSIFDVEAWTSSMLSNSYPTRWKTSTLRSFLNLAFRILCRRRFSTARLFAYLERGSLSRRIGKTLCTSGGPHTTVVPGRDNFFIFFSLLNSQTCMIFGSFSMQKEAWHFSFRIPFSISCIGNEGWTGVSI